MHTLAKDEIEALINCPKIITIPPKNNMTQASGHQKNNMTLESTDGEHRFFAFMRVNAFFEENFSIGLDYFPRDGTGSICLLRCNGPHGEHSNGWPSNHPHYDYHIHLATEENIAQGFKSERYAEITNEYATYEEALVFFLKHCNILDAEKYFPRVKQLTIF